MGCAHVQVAPRELLIPTGMLSPATHRALMHPPIPLQLSNVPPGPEFPAPDGTLRTSASAGKVFGNLQLPQELVQSASRFCCISLLRKHPTDRHKHALSLP